MDRGTTDPMDALDLLANDIRIDILRTLAEADGPLSFTELRDRTGVRDSGQFNYHLTKLCEFFVRDVPDGYELGHAGTRVIEATAGHGAASTERDGDVGQNADATEATECPVCGESDCEKLFHVHLTPPWRR